MATGELLRRYKASAKRQSFLNINALSYLFKCVKVVPVLVKQNISNIYREMKEQLHVFITSALGSGEW
jgi:hypothetical protein